MALLEFGGGVDLTDVRAYLREAGISPGKMRVLEVSDGEGESPGNRPLPPDKARAIMADWRRGTPFQEIFQTHPDAGAFYESLEATMDAEVAGALAPGVEADLYFASGGADGWRRAICAASGLPYAGSVTPPPDPDGYRPPVALSISWGFQERQLQPMKLRILHMALELATRRGITVVCSSGDRGSRMGGGPGDPLGVEFPASSTAVLGCGGTALEPGERGKLREVAWRQTLLGMEMASGGGMSGYFRRPDFQSSIVVGDSSGTWVAEEDGAFDGRWTPDVSALASFAPGVKLLMAGEPFAGGGTSAATPIWAALVARLASALGRPLGRLTSTLYALSRDGVVRSVDRGTNDLAPRAKGPLQYRAGPGWDACTGLGVPDGRALLKALEEGP
jgi:kumamolisin